MSRNRSAASLGAPGASSLRTRGLISSVESRTPTPRCLAGALHQAPLDQAPDPVGKS